MERRQKLMRVSLDYLRETLGLPETTSITRISTQDEIQHAQPYEAVLQIEDVSFPPVPIGCHLNFTDAEFTRRLSLNQFVGWSHEKMEVSNAR